MDLIPAIDIHAHPVLGQFSEKSVATCMNQARRFSVVRMCVMGSVSFYGENPGEKEVRAVNDESMRLVEKYPEVFTGFCFLNPRNSRRFIIEETERCVSGKGFRGIKLWVSTKASDPGLDVIMEKALEHRIPVLQHTWYKSMGNRQGESDPGDVACLASRFPEAVIIMAHLGGCGIRGVIDIERFPNVLVETGGSQPASGILETAVKRLGPERILFGSDTPCRSFPSQLGRIYGAGISRKQKEMILRENALNLLGLK